jgi:hypothetical protein
MGLTHMPGVSVVNSSYPLSMHLERLLAVCRKPPAVHMGCCVSLVRVSLVRMAGMRLMMVSCTGMAVVYTDWPARG